MIGGQLLASERPRLWALAYRMTGLATAADEIAQETLTRALARPAVDDGRPLGPWLWAVCVNLSRDHLRRRRRQGRPHVWLPSPAPVDEEEVSFTRYSRRESATIAFLVALEALTPTQRAVLLLRDVFEHGVEEVAELLGTRPGAVRASHLRARRAVAAYEARRPHADVERNGAALAAFLGALAVGDAAAAVACLAPDVVLRSDGGGLYTAASMPVIGAEKVVMFLTRIARGVDATPTAVWLNGGPMVHLRPLRPIPGRSPESVVGVDVDDRGRITQIHWLLDPRRMTHVAATR